MYAVERQMTNSYVRVRKTVVRHTQTLNKHKNQHFNGKGGKYVAQTPKQLMRKIQRGINHKYDLGICISTAQFFTKRGKKDPSTLYTVKIRCEDQLTQKRKYVEVFSSFNVVYIIYYLKEIWCNHEHTDCGSLPQDYLDYKDSYEERDK